jgi:1,4-alpha-glucan branching enzyme
VIESRVEHDGCVHVTFRLPNINRAERISVVGEFNAWCPTANPMHVEGDELVTEIVLQAGRTYRFRYLLDDDRWRTTGPRTTTSPTSSAATTRCSTSPTL